MTTPSNQNLHQGFAVQLRTLLDQFGIRNAMLAEKMHVTAQYISKLTTGKAVLGKQQMEHLVHLLADQHVPRRNLYALIHEYVVEKTGTVSHFLDPDFCADTPLEKKLLSDFRMLSDPLKKEALLLINGWLADDLMKKEPAK